MTPRPTKVLIVDDSPVCRMALRSALEDDPLFKVAGEASDGLEGIRLASELRPDVVTLDLQMPRLGGLETIDALRQIGITRIVVVTGQVRVGNLDSAFAAISRGALDLLLKPSGNSPEELEAFVHRLKELARAPAATGEVSSVNPARRALRPRVAPAVAGIGASSGGPGAIATVLKRLPASFQVPIVIVQHIAEAFLEGFVSWLRTETSRPVRVAKAGDLVGHGELLVAPSGRNALVTHQRMIELRPPEHGEPYSPTVDCLFSSLATVYGEAAVGVLLTGMGSDGAEGMARIHKSRGITIAQDRATSAVYGMPAAAVKEGAVDLILPLHEISSALADLTISATSSLSVPAGPKGRKKILIVDDSPIVLEAARIALEEAGHEVVVLDNPLQLAFAARRFAPSVILVDVNMPAIKGDALTEIMRSYLGASHARIVLYSDIATSELSALAARCGAVGFLQKNADEKTFVREVERYLDN